MRCLQRRRKNPAYWRHWTSRSVHIVTHIPKVFPKCKQKKLKKLKKNPAYGSQRISRPMQMDEPKKKNRGCMITSRNDVHFLVYIFSFRVLMPSWRTAGTDAIVKDSLIMWPEGQWEALKKIIWKGDKQTGIANLWKNRPKGRFFENITNYLSPVMYHQRILFCHEKHLISN